MLAFSSDWTTLAGWRGLKTRLNSLRYAKGIVANPNARHHIGIPKEIINKCQSVESETRRALTAHTRHARHRLAHISKYWRNQ